MENDIIINITSPEDVKNALERVIKDKVESIAKFLSIREVKVVLQTSGDKKRWEVKLNVIGENNFHISVEKNDIYEAINEALDKLEELARKEKDRK